ncbi:MAG: molybdopterin-dependent oxidoreductase [Proteobacteria bacterium]|nr:molybdopterin-dependent oxidoreductase [Pseudomonadota bacterium]
MREKLRVETQARSNSMKEGKWIKTTCKMCLHTCAIEAHVTNRGIVNSIKGDVACPSNMGKMCSKGRGTIQRHYDPYRIKYPLKRTNPKKGPNEDPGWVRISWDEALDTIADKMKKMIEKDPREFVYSITDFHKIDLWPWALIFGNANQFHVVGTYCGAGYHITAGIYNSAFAGVGDYKYCNYWIQIGGGDGFSSHLHLAAGQKRMADARSRGMKVVCIEPRLSTSAAKADEWIPNRPGTDRHFALAFMHCLMHEHKIYDAEFLKWHANGAYLIKKDGWFQRSKTEKGKAPWSYPRVGPMDFFPQTTTETFKPLVWDSVDNCAKTFDDPTIKDLALEGEYEVDGEKVRPAFQFAKDKYKEFTPEWGEKITDIPADTIRRISKEFGEAACIGQTIEIDGEVYPFRPVSINWYRGAQAHKYSAMDNQSFILANMIVGAFSVPGGLCGVQLGTPHNLWTVEPGPDGLLDPKPHQLGPLPPFNWPPNTSQLMELYPIGVPPGQNHFFTQLDPKKYGMEFKPSILLLYHSNAMWSLPGNQETWHKVMRSFDFIWAIDLFVNETTVFADILLPDTDYLESWTLLMCEPPATEGLNLRQPVTDPLYPEARDGWDVLVEIADRIGKLGDLNNLWNFACQLGNDPELALDPKKKYTRTEYLDLIARYHTRHMWPPERDLKWFMEHGHNVIDKPADRFYYSSDKRGKDCRKPFYCEYMWQVKKELEENIANAKPPLPFKWDTSGYQPIPDAQFSPVWNEPPEYDMWAITFKEHFMNFTENLSIPWTRELADRDPHHRGLLLNTKTAEKKGIKDGDTIEVRSQFGVLTGRAVLTEGIHPETVGISNATNRTVSHSPITRKGGGQFNTLLANSFEYTDEVSGAMESVAAVKVTKINAPAPDTKSAIKLDEYKAGRKWGPVLKLSKNK